MYGSMPQGSMGPAAPGINDQSIARSKAGSILRNLMKMRAKHGPDVNDDLIYNEMATKIIGGSNPVANDHQAAIGYLRNLVGSVRDPKTGQTSWAPIPFTPPTPQKPAAQPLAEGEAMRAAMPRDWAQTPDQLMKKYYSGLADQGQ